MDFNSFLMSLVQLGQGRVSDLHFKVGAPPLLRLGGQLEPARFAKLGPDDTKRIAQSLIGSASLEGVNDLDTAYSIPGIARFRVNVFKQKGNYSVVMRVISLEIPSMEDLGLPEILKTIALEERGLVLVTGPTGSGKSSTLAAMIRHVNETKKAHVLTIEDPIEFLHQDNLCSINQREIGGDTLDFGTGLRAALRQDPDIILVGEMRDVETISIAIKAAETGHLVFSTLHTVDAAKTINRIVDSFPHEQQPQLRLQLAANLRAVVSQRLLPRTDGGRVVALEIMRTTTTIQDCIENPEKTAGIRDVIGIGREQYGMQLFDQHLRDLYIAKQISLETALGAASSPSDFQRALSFD
jgi:twitching motility protein PilT